MTSDKVDVSIVLPVHNEAGAIAVLLDEIIDSLVNTSVAGAEIVVVDDASADGSAETVEKAAAEIMNRSPAGIADIRVVRLPCRCGQSYALMAGFKAASGHLIVSMDADGQYDPADIPRFLAAVECFDMVCGVRRIRSDGFSRKVCSVIANAFRNILTCDSTSDAGCTFRIMRKDCVSALSSVDGKLFGCELFFHPLVLRKKNYRVGQITVTHRPRSSGRSKYRLLRGRMISGLRACLRAREILRTEG